MGFSGRGGSVLSSPHLVCRACWRSCGVGLLCDAVVAESAWVEPGSMGVFVGEGGGVSGSLAGSEVVVDMVSGKLQEVGGRE